jgi:hypothetical protein
MMADPTLEEAYIALCLYKNQDVGPNREQGPMESDLVQIHNVKQPYATGPDNTKQAGNVKKGLFKVEAVDEGKRTYSIRDELGKLSTVRANQIKSVVQKNKFATAESERLRDIPDPLERDPMFQNTVQFKPPNPQQRHVNDVNTNAKTLKGAREVLQLEAGEKQMHPKEQRITPEILNNQPPVKPQQLSLTQLRPPPPGPPQLGGKVQWKSRIRIDDVKQALATEQVKDKIYENEQLGFAGQWGVEPFYKAVEKKLNKNEENPKVTYGLPITKPKTVTESAKLHHMLSNLRVARVNENDPHKHQDIPGEISDKLLKNNEVKNEPELKAALPKRGRGRPRKVLPKK